MARPPRRTVATEHTTTAQTVDAFIADFPPEVRVRLTAMRATIREHAPDAEERIS